MLHPVKSPASVRISIKTDIFGSLHVWSIATVLPGVDDAANSPTASLCHAHTNGKKLKSICHFMVSNVILIPSFIHHEVYFVNYVHIWSKIDYNTDVTKLWLWTASPGFNNSRTQTQNKWHPSFLYELWLELISVGQRGFLLIKITSNSIKIKHLTLMHVLSRIEPNVVLKILHFFCINWFLSVMHAGFI